MDGEDALHGHPLGDFADGDGFLDSPALALDHVALEDLDALLLSFDDAHVDAQGVTGTEIGQIGLELVRGEFAHETHVHLYYPLVNGVSRPRFCLFRFWTTWL